VVYGKMIFCAILLGYAAAYLSRWFLDDATRPWAWVVGAVVGLVSAPFARVRLGGVRVGEEVKDPDPERDEGGRPAGLMFSFGMGALAGFFVGLVLGGFGMLTYFSWGESPWGSPVDGDDVSLVWILLAPATAVAALGGVLFSVASATGKATRH